MENINQNKTKLVTDNDALMQENNKLYNNFKAC